MVYKSLLFDVVGTVLTLELSYFEVFVGDYGSRTPSEKSGTPRNYQRGSPCCHSILIVFVVGILKKCCYFKDHYLSTVGASRTEQKELW